MSRVGYIRTIKEDGEIEEIEVSLDTKKKKVSKKVSNDKSNKKQEEKQASTSNKETISIKRTKS